MDRSRAALIIPAFNEAATIGRVVEELSPYGPVIVVDDGSTDRTYEVAKAHGATVVRHVANRGYDAALESGFGRAEALGIDLVVTVDADGQHPPELVASYLKALSEGADLVLGVRPRLPRLAERLFARATRRLFGIADPFCGMKGYQLDLYRAQGAFDTYGSIGTQLMLNAVRRGAKVVSLPVAVRPRTDRPRFGSTASANLRLLRAALLGLLRTGEQR